MKQLSTLVVLFLFGVCRSTGDVTKYGKQDLSGCRISEVRASMTGNSYLKKTCPGKGTTAVSFVCPGGSLTYQVNYTDSCWRQEYTRICPDDPGSYQACGHFPCSENAGAGESLCGTYMCHNKKWHRKGTLRSGEFNKGNSCNGRYDCYNTVQDEVGCGGVKRYHCNDTFATTIDQQFVCDMKCDCLYCEDEARCNGVEYGVQCRWKNGEYRTPNAVCDNVNTTKSVPGCLDRDEDGACTPDNAIRTCRTSYRGEPFQRILLPIHICAVAQRSAPACTDGWDQVNCTDESRVALTCTCKGRPITLSPFAICMDYADLCDDNYQNYCLEPEGGCVIHKNQMCDGVSDCPGESDEGVLCRAPYVSHTTCKRRVGVPRNGTISLKELAIPLSWVFDGIRDCEDGKDENETHWRECKTPPDIEGGRRFIENGTQCSDIFVCPNHDRFLERHDLCDKIESCSGENAICSKSRHSLDLMTQVYTDHHSSHKVLFFCYRGLEQLYTHPGVGGCVEHVFPGIRALGVSPDVLFLPRNVPMEPCQYSYGEQHVFYGCTTVPHTRHDSCINMRQSRIYTLTEDHTLTVVYRQKDRYRSSLFPCRNKKCIPYRKVCNLADDCGDGSDEEGCSNSFKCNTEKVSSSSYISLSKVCDGRIDCMNATDECNEQCKIRIIDSTSLEIIAWIFGIFSIFFNLIVLVKSWSYVTTADSLVKLMNKAMIILIASGDFLMGVYLSGIAVANVAYDQYCAHRYDWLTGITCAILGVLSTTAAQLSLLSITVLSIFRVCSLNSMRYIGRESLTKRARAFVFVVALSVLAIGLTIACAPLVPQLKDYFVNGIYYPESFLFLGAVDKELHYEVFRKYYGKIKDPKNLSWDRITSMVERMYSHDYGGISLRKLHFYGNDGVCLFKYMVTGADPQVVFSSSILFANFACFLVVSVCYILIELQTKRSLEQVCRDHRELVRRNRKLQTKISIIILTDFLCWVPFILTCTLHLTEVTDATEFYPIFSIVILPLNSVINPILYDPTVAHIVSKPIILIYSLVCKAIIPLRRMLGIPEPRAKVSLRKHIDPKTQLSVTGIQIIVTESQS